MIRFWSFITELENLGHKPPMSQIEFRKGKLMSQDKNFLHSFHNKFRHSKEPEYEVKQNHESVEAVVKYSQLTKTFL